MPKSSKQPPLSWLRAFESAGRTGSFKSAAEDLNVSPSTISHQIRDLESFLGVPLFHRGRRSIELTAEGREYLEPLRAGFQLIREAKPADPISPRSFRVGAFPFLANEIITPHVTLLHTLLPDHHVQVYTKTELDLLMHVDPTERLDVVVRYGKVNGRFPGFVSRKLCDVSLLPIVGPQFAEVTSVEDLLQLPLIRVLGPFEGWNRWLAAHCPAAELPEFSIQTDSFHSAALAVSRGEGASLGIMPYLKPWLEEGRVLGLEQYALRIEEEALFAVFAPHNQSSPTVGTFIDWLAGALA